MKLHDMGVFVQQEGDAAGFLGASLECDKKIGLIDIKQPGLNDRVIIYVGPGNGMAKVKYTHAGSIPLVKNEDGVPVSGSFNYSSVVEILLYLSGDICPDIAFSVNCCARYICFVPILRMKRP